MARVGIVDKYKSSTQVSSDKTAFKRVIPPLAFIFALCLLVICCYNSGYTGLPPTEKRYVAAKAGIASLKQNDKKNMLREPWEDLAKEFRSIYDGDPSWPNRPAALFRAAESLEELAKRSCSKADARKAINCYETLALRHASSRLADDALFRAARMRAAWLRDEKGALNLLERVKKQYPKGDMVSEAAALEKVILASTKGKADPAALKAAEAREDVLEDQPAQTPLRINRDKFAGDLPLRYKAAKSRMASLRNNSVKSCWRQPWEDLRDEFLRIAQAAKNRIAPQALYQAAACQQALALCSRLSADNKNALTMFLNVTKAHPGHALADDALLMAARIQYALPSGKNRANDILDRIFKEYPKGDMVAEAKRLRSIWDGENTAIAAKKSAKAPAVQSSVEKPELQVLSWDSISRNSVEIVLEMSAPAKFSTRLQGATQGKPAKLFLDLENASVVNDVRKGVTVQGSLLKAVRVQNLKSGGSTLCFDFREVRRFDARSEDNPCRIILSVASGKAALPQRKKNATLVASSGKTAKKTKTQAINARHVNNMASQLGLTVQRVFIDAGHGGKDPGTNHNRIMERAITLDVALSLGRLLTANGLEVVYSRTKDRAVALSERTRLANAAKADLFVSIHVNANDNTAVNGFETYYLNLASNPQAARVAMLENAGSDRRLSDMRGMLADVMLNARVDESRRLAADIQRLSIFRLKKRNYTVRNNGVKSAPFHVLLGAQMPAVLVEIGYCSNSAEARNLANQRYRLAIAEGLAEGILAYRDRLIKNRTAGNFLTEDKADAM